MEQTKYSTNSSHKKGAHLKFEERVIIQTRLRDGWSLRKIDASFGYALKNGIFKRLNVQCKCNK